MKDYREWLLTLSIREGHVVFIYGISSMKESSVKRHERFNQTFRSFAGTSSSFFSLSLLILQWVGSEWFAD